MSDETPAAATRKPRAASWAACRKIKAAAVDDFISLFALARDRRMSFDAVLARYNGIIGRPSHRRLTVADKEYLRGYSDALFKSHHHALEWRLWLDGRLIVGADVPDGRWPDVRPAGFYYKGSDAIWSAVEPRA